MKPIWNYLHRGLLIILGLLIIATIGAISFLGYTLVNLRGLVTSGGNASATALILQEMVINLQDIQTGVRGYVMSGDRANLAPYDEGLKQLPLTTDALNHSPDVLLKASERKDLIVLATKRAQIAKDVVTAYDTQGPEAAQALVATRQGQQVMDTLRTRIRVITDRDLQNISSTQRRAQASMTRALYVAASMALLTLCTSAAIIWYFRRTILRERALESTKNEFLSLASHQLRTPATAVKQYIAMLQDGFMGDLNEAQHKALDVAYKNNETEIKIVNSLLGVAKLNLGRIEMHKQVVDLVKLCRQVARSCAHSAKEAGITLKIERAGPVMATVDETYIKGVVLSLLDNAILYSKQNTVVTIKINHEGDNACISVCDQGIGIRRRDIGRLFSKFTRFDNEFSANSTGSGLSLYWVYKVVQLHGGRIDISSREGKGSTFTVFLPVR